MLCFVIDGKRIIKDDIGLLVSSPIISPEYINTFLEDNFSAADVNASRVLSDLSRLQRGDIIAIINIPSNLVEFVGFLGITYNETIKDRTHLHRIKFISEGTVVHLKQNFTVKNLVFTITSYDELIERNHDKKYKFTSDSTTMVKMGSLHPNSKQNYKPSIYDSNNRPICPTHKLILNSSKYYGKKMLICPRWNECEYTTTISR